MNFSKYLTDLDSASKVKKFGIYQDIIQHCLKHMADDIYRFYDELIALMEEYLAFDDVPSDEMILSFSKSSDYIFSYIRTKGDIQNFHKYIKAFQKYQHIITDAVIKAQINQTFGYIFWKLQNIKKSRKFLEESLNIINKSGVIKAIPGRYTNLGFLYEFTGDLNKAEQYYWEGIHFAQKNHYQESMSMAYNALGRLNLNRKAYKKAQGYFKAALELFETDTQNNDYISILMNLASTHVFMEEFDKAIDCLHSIQNDWLKEKNPEMYYSSYINIAINYSNMGKLEQAEEAILKAKNYAKEHQNWELLFGCDYNLGNIYYKLKKYELAEKFSSKALKLAQKFNNPKQENISLNQLAVLYLETGKPEKALPLFEKAEKIVKKNSDEHELCNILINKSDCYYQLQEFQNAYTYLKEYIGIKNKVDQENREKEKILEKTEQVQSGWGNQVIFKSGYTMVSRELSSLIGMPVIGQSPTFEKVIQEALLVAGNDQASILLKGESGTGKELIARLIHYASNRHKAPFVPVNSASFNSELARSALFGHEEGAFTGASSKHIGYFEEAHMGTIFLDEIADMPIDIQAHILRVLETKKIRPVGCDHLIDINFRLISATNKDIPNMIDENLFRLDLLNRINTLEITIPPLRDRKDDIPIFIDYYLTEISKRLKRKRPEIEASVISILLEYDYPGNVREFINIMEKLIIFCRNDYISEENICFLKTSSMSQEPIITLPANLNLQENEYTLICEALKQTNNVQVHAAKLLGITPFALNRRLKKYNINIF